MIGCSGSSGIWNSGCPQDATNKLLELREPMKGHLTEVDSGRGEGRLEGGAQHPGSGAKQHTARDPRLESSAERSPRLRPRQGKLCPAAPTGNPPRLQPGPGGACSPCSPAFLLRTSLQNQPPNFLFSGTSVPLRVLPTRPRFCHSLLGLDGNSPLLLNKPTFAGNETGGVISKGNGRINEDTRRIGDQHAHTTCTSAAPDDPSERERKRRCHLQPQQKERRAPEEV